MNMTSIALIHEQLMNMTWESVICQLQQPEANMARSQAVNAGQVGLRLVHLVHL